jgi:hypothetical protein
MGTLRHPKLDTTNDSLSLVYGHLLHAETVVIDRPFLLTGLLKHITVGPRSVISGPVVGIINVRVAHFSEPVPRPIKL